MKRIAKLLAVAVCGMAIGQGPLRAAEEPKKEPAEPEKPPAAEAAKPPEEAPRPAARILHVPRPGGLNAKTFEKMKAQHKYIQSLDVNRSKTAMKEDEIRQFRNALNDASILLFWPEERPDGSTLQMYQYGVNIVIKPETYKKFDDKTLTPNEAHELAKDFCRLLQLRASLNADNLPEATRAAGQNEYNALLTKTFAQRTKPVE